MKFSRKEIRQLRQYNKEWPAELTRVPEHQLPAEVTGYNSGGAPRIATYRSRDFLVQVFDEGGDILRLSVNRTDWDFNQQRWREDISWDDLQRLKVEAGYGDRWAVEVFPAEGATVNVANMRHIWILQEAPSFAWRPNP